MQRAAIYILGLLFSFSVNAQITLENTNTGEILKVTKLTDTTTYYYATNTTELILYNMNHSVYKTLALPFVFTGDYSMIHYVSEKLFDNDSEVEYMHIAYYTGQGGESASKGHVKIYNEDGTLLFSEDSILVDRFYFLQGIGPMILNTEAGTKMIMRKAGPAAKSTRVYSLTGQLYESLPEPGGLQQSYLSHAYPNPTGDLIRVDYDFPEGAENADLVFYDTSGNEVKRLNVGSAFDHLVISTRNLAAGTYFYHLQTSLGSSEGKKMIKIK